MINEIVQAK